ncbi:hypothetical protein FOL47_008064 [Perkinsus chesapeaki]|uniref:Calcium-dependent protein kinase 1 n=1 Tax=Perkinsus chesapeaki TaxID=330153 RepID=A0A7J6N3C6_PERCH|nr:hypothetical protein FOL47_008064 [Perkinsus chesapeaki]
MAVTIQRKDFILDNFGKNLYDYYDVEKKSLGTGTYGSVSKAKNKATGVLRAVKTMSKSQVKNVPRFRQEIAIMKMLDHPNIIRLYETFEDAKNIYLVMELCTGGELFDRIIDKGYFTENDAAVIMKQMFAAVYYCHKHHIMHRDLKPENFLFLDKTPDSPLKVIDFGLASLFEPGEFMKTKAGTPYYVAPQVLQGYYNEKCDSWSCGVIMYILLCGYPPFYGDNDNEILTRVRRGKYTFPDADWKDISDDAKDLIRKLLTYDEGNRWTAEQALNHRWIQTMAATDFHGDKNDHKKVVASLRNFRAQNKMKKVALTVIAQQLDESNIGKLKKTFQALDTNNDGMLSVQEIKEGMEQSGVALPEDLEEIMKEVDSDGSGAIDYTEFIAATMDKKLYIKKDVCWAAFRVFDRDGNGKISKEELQEVLGNDDVRTALGSDLVTQMINEVDLNGDGEIDFDEFMQMMQKST